MEGYALLDSGGGRKLERFGPYIMDRPAAQVLWKRRRPELWEKADARFERVGDGDGNWSQQPGLPARWTARIAGVSFHIAPTPFGHLGVFPEQAPLWEELRTLVSDARRQGEIKVLNLYAYSGGATLACARAGAEVVHLDASRPTVAQARENAELSGASGLKIHWVVEDVLAFLKRELKRGHRYQGVVLDPPSFGRGTRGEVFKIERDVVEVLALAAQLLAPDARFMLLSCHTPGFTPTTLGNLLGNCLPAKKGSLDCGEMLLSGADALSLPSGTWACWKAS